jgi:hypothetical protein
MSAVNVPRNAAIIGIQILQLIPDSNTEFKEEMKNLIYNEYAYCAPEMLTYPAAWLKLETIMHKYVPIPKEEWEKKVVGIYVGTPIE